MESSYGIRKLHPILIRTPDLLSLKKYGNLLSLLEVEVQPDALTALTQYYDPLSVGTDTRGVREDHRDTPGMISALFIQRPEPFLGLSGQNTKDF
ncbi:hypothetical protein CR513_44297, partial [Mucuna pruriens]